MVDSEIINTISNPNGDGIPPVGCDWEVNLAEYQFRWPTDVAQDGSNLVVVDSGQLFKIHDRIVVTPIGATCGDSNNDDDVKLLAVDNDGGMYLVGETTAAIVKLDGGGGGGSGRTISTGEMGSISAVAIDGTGRLVVAKDDEEAAGVFVAESAEFWVEQDSVFVPRPVTNEVFMFDLGSGRHLETR
jgi:hypothetical protein